MTDERTPQSRRRGLRVLGLWILAMAVALGALAAMPAFAERYFWNWFGSQPHVIDVLRERGQWQAAASRAERMIENTPWDPRPLLWRAEILRDQVMSQGRDPAADPAVHAAYEAAARAFFRTSGYPFALSPTWKRMMAETFRTWAATLARRGAWEQVAFALEYASDIDERAARQIIETLRAQTRNPGEVDPAILEAQVKLLLWHATWQEAEAALERFAPHLPPDVEAELEMRVLLWRTRLSPLDEEINPVLPLREDLPVRILRMRWGVERQNRWHRRLRTGREATVEDDWTRNRGGWEGFLTTLYYRMDQTEVRHLTAEAELTGPDGVERDIHRGWPLWVAGELVYEWDQPVNESDHCWVMMSGDPTLGIWPAVEIQFDHGPSQLIYVRSRDVMAYPVEVPEGGFRRLTVRYLNDGGFPKLTLDEMGEAQVEYHIEDRNLHFNGLWWIDWEPPSNDQTERR